MSNNQYLLSVIVPCYNSLKYLDKLLDSVVESNKDDIEVILVDDVSDEEESQYQLLVEDYISSYWLSIKYVRNKDHYGSPAHSRNVGSTLATGEYITFVDHDDALLPEGIESLRKFIKGYNRPEMIVCGIRQVDLEGNTQHEEFGMLLYTHGKFYNREKFWKKYNIKFEDDMYYLEDMYMSCLTSCILAENGLEPKFTDFTTYLWTNNPSSLGHSIEGQQNKDHIPAVIRKYKTYTSITKNVLFKFWDKATTPQEILFHWMLRDIIHSYLMIQHNDFCKDKLVEIFKPVYEGICERSGYSDIELYDYIVMSPEGQMVYQDELAGFLTTVETFEPKETFADFMRKHILFQEDYK